MTSLRDLFKKTKKATKETTDKILDADLEDNFAKVGEATASGIPYIGKALKIIFFIFVPITIAILVGSFLFKTYISSPKWCNNTYYNIFKNEETLEKLNWDEAIKLRDEFISYSCFMHLKDDENKRIFSTNYNFLTFFDQVEYFVMTDEEIEQRNKVLELMNPKNKLKKNELNNQLLNELNQLID